jgi:hypothetical protein
MAETRQAVMRLNLNLEAFNYDRTYDYESHPNVMIGKMDVVCNHCQAKIFRGESPGTNHERCVPKSIRIRS